MEEIKRLSEAVGEEVHDARKYIKWALEVKEKDPELASLLNTLAGQEMDHMKMLHAATVRIIEKYRKEHGEPPPPMQFVYDYLHAHHIEDAAEVKAMMALYRES